MARKPWYVINPKLRAEVEEGIEAGLKYTEISQLTGLDDSVVAKFARERLEIHRQKTRTPVPTPTPVPTLSALDREIHDAEQRLRELREQRDRARVTFELDGRDILIIGLEEQPLKADASRVLRWLVSGGAQELRTWLTQRLRN